MDILYQVRVPLLDNKFPAEVPKSLLEKKIQASLGTIGREIVKDYFTEGNGHYPQNLSFFIYARDRDIGDELAGGLIATTEEVNGFKFTYYNIIFVDTEHKNKGIEEGLIRSARKVNDGKKTLPGVAITHDQETSEVYGHLSGIIGEDEGYFIHGFGFYDKQTGKPMFENAEEIFQNIAEHVVKKYAATVRILQAHQSPGAPAVKITS